MSFFCNLKSNKRCQNVTKSFAISLFATVQLHRFNKQYNGFEELTPLRHFPGNNPGFNIVKNRLSVVLLY